MQNFRALGALPLDPRASGGWGLCPQTPSLRQLGASPPDLQFSPPIANFWLRACASHIQGDTTHSPPRVSPSLATPLIICLSFIVLNNFFANMCVKKNCASPTKSLTARHWYILEKQVIYTSDLLLCLDSNFSAKTCRE